MDDKARTAIETEISAEKTIIKDAEDIVAADEAKLAADKAQTDAAKEAALNDSAAPGEDEKPAPEQTSADPVEQAGASDIDPDGKPATGGTPEPLEPKPDAPASDLSPDHVTPLPDNGPLGPIVPDTAEAGAGEIVKPARPKWPWSVQEPSMGRIVHYRAASSGEMPDGNEYHAAIITKVNDDWTISLSAFPEGRNPMFLAGVPLTADLTVGAEQLPGTWCWPARV